MNLTRLRLLKALCGHRASLNGLMTGTVLNDSVSPALADRYIAELAEDGLIEKVGMTNGHTIWTATELGQFSVQQCEMVPSRVHGNHATPPGSYTSPKWETRQGSEAHKAIPSRGNRA